MTKTKMKAKEGRTPGPWRYWEHADSSGLCIGPPYSERWMSGDGDAGFRVHDVCTISGGSRNGLTDKDRANARFICLAVNSHDELVKALESLLEFNEGMPCYNFDQMPAVIQARAALARVKTSTGGEG